MEFDIPIELIFSTVITGAVGWVVKFMREQQIHNS